MREAVYLIPILALAGAVPAGAIEAPKQHPNEREQHGTPARLDLRTQVSDVLSFPEFQAAAPAGRRALSAVPAHQRPGLVLDGARGALAWVLPAGWDFVAAAAFASSALVAHAAWPAGGAVPSLKASAALSTTLKNSNFPVLDVNLSVTRNWQLDAPIGGTYLDCAIRLDVSTAASPSLALQTPCGRFGHFGAYLHQRF